MDILADLYTVPIFSPTQPIHSPDLRKLPRVMELSNLGAFAIRDFSQININTNLQKNRRCALIENRNIKTSLIFWYKPLSNTDRTDGACETTDKIHDFFTGKYSVVIYYVLCNVSFGEIFVSPTHPRFLVYHICISKLILKGGFMKNTKIIDKAGLQYLFSHFATFVLF